MNEIFGENIPMATQGYTAEQWQARQDSKWTMVQMILAPLQLLTFVISLGLIIYYLTTGNGYWVATVSVFIKIALLWAITITGMFWEHDVYGKWFLAEEFFWEDFMNAVALGMHNLYFIALMLGWSEQDLMWLMLVAYISYLVNFGQFLVRGLQSRKQREAFQDMDGMQVVEGQA
ncbi:MAG: 2-vinyl bacteriochlorophyllide hydratase [Chloroflexota bacterium]